jgi:hypothetical protein
MARIRAGASQPEIEEEPMLAGGHTAAHGGYVVGAGRGLIVDQFAGGGGVPAGDLQVLLGALPMAQQGDVITPEYHNSLRAAILLLARRFGIEMAGGDGVWTFTPALSPDGTKTPWLLAPGVAQKPAQGTTASGWLALTLPDGVRIDGMIVVGRRGSAGVKTFSVKLVRQAVSGRRSQLSSLDLVDMSPEATDPFATKGPVEIPGLGLAAVDEARSVNNRKFKYLVTAELEFTEAATAAEIHAIQIVCSK